MQQPLEERKSRLDYKKKSIIPRPSYKSASLERSVSRSTVRTNSRQPAANRHRSVDSTVRTKQLQEPNLLNQKKAARKQRQNERRAFLINALNPTPVIEKRPLADRKWQKETSNRILEHLRNNKQTSQILPSGVTSLKSISVKSFLNIINAYTDHKCKLNINDYMEKLPNFARRILYPGVITKSWLQTINAMHTYPQMLAFLSYIQELSDYQELVSNTFNLNLLFGANDSTPDRKIYVIRYRYFFQCWRLFQKNKKFILDTSKLIKDLKELKGVSEPQIQAMQNDIHRLKKALENHRVFETEKREEDLQKEIRTIEEDLKYLQKKTSMIKHNSDSANTRNQFLRTTLDSAKNQTRALKTKLKTLQEGASSQNICVKQYQNLLKENQYMKATAESRNQILEDIKKMAFLRDVELAKAQKNALELTENFNRSLIKIASIGGIDLSAYSLNERELSSENTAEKIREARSFLEKCEIDVKNLILTYRKKKHEHNKKNASNVIKTLTDEIFKLNNRFEALQKSKHEKRATAIEDLDSKMEAVEEHRKKIEEHIKNIHKDWELAYQNYELLKSTEKKWQKEINKLQNVEPTIRKLCEHEVKLLTQAHGIKIRKKHSQIYQILEE